MKPVGDSVKTHQDGEQTYSVRAVIRVIDILDAVRTSSDGVSLTQVAELASLPKPSTFRYLTTLESRQYVERDQDTGLYRVGPALLAFNDGRFELLVARARPHLEALRDEFQETINLGTLDGDRILYLEIVESPRVMRLAARRGDRDPIHSTALGKAIAAQLTEDDVLQRLRAAGMEIKTMQTIANPADYLHELEQVRTRGFALDNGEHEEGARCIAVALPIADARAAISLSAPAVRFPIEKSESFAAALTRAAHSIAQA
jgi:IclR family acetate operon transcriptional repressor